VALAETAAWTGVLAGPPPAAEAFAAFSVAVWVVGDVGILGFAAVDA